MDTNTFSNDGLLEEIIGPFQNSTLLSLSDSGQYCDHHFTHFAVGANPVVDKPDTRHSLKMLDDSL